MPEKTKILLLGALGQLGTALRQETPDGLEILGVDCQQLDITDKQAVSELVGNFQPAQILNVAAYTDVEGAEQNPDLAMAVNCQGVAHLASAAQAVHARVIHLSTDYVFNGHGDTPYRPTGQPDPLNAYGISKLAGEKVLRALLPHDHLILRTAWLYSRWGENFMKKMLRLMQEKAELRVVSDQVGPPTSAGSLAEILWRLVQRPDISGTHHWTDAGQATWYDFACEIHRLATEFGLLDHPCHIIPIATAEYSTLVTRPKWSVLDTTSLCEVLDVQPLDWRSRLREVLQDFAVGQGLP